MFLYKTGTSSNLDMSSSSLGLKTDLEESFTSSNLQFQSSQ